MPKVKTHAWEGEAPAEPGFAHNPRLGRSLALPVIAIALLLLATRASAEMRVMQTRHYRVHTDLDQTLAEDLGRRLDSMYDEYARRLADFSRSSQEQSLEVYLFQRQEEYADFTQNRAPNTGGVFLPHRRMLAAFYEGAGRDALRRTLQHEAFHQFAQYAISPNLPPWLNEGLAVLFEEGIWMGNGFVLGEVPPRRVRQLRADHAGRRLTQFQEFMSMNNEQWTQALGREPGLGAAQYNQAWAMVHFLVFSVEKGEYKYRKRFLDMLKLMHEDRDARTAFELALSRNIDGFQTRFAQFVPTLTATPRAALIERLEVLGDMLIELRSMGKRYQTIEDFRNEVTANSYRLRYTKGEVRWTSESDPKLYFTALDGRPLHNDEMYFEPRSQAPMPDLVYRGPELKLRMRFYDLGDIVQHEVLVEGS